MPRARPQHRLLCLLASIMFLTGSGIPGSAAAAQAGQPAGSPGGTELPSPEEIQARFADQLNRRSFPPSGITGWREVATWRRVALLLFPPGTDERSEQPERPDPDELLQVRFELFQRRNHGRDEFNLIEEISRTPQGGGFFTNFFPVFEGNLDTFVFFNHGAGSVPGVEFRYDCRALTSRQDRFLVCRAVRGSDGSVTYLTMVGDDAGTPTATDPASLPSDQEILTLFADQIGQRTFPSSGVTAWQQTAVWRRVAVLEFPGADETVGPPPPHMAPPLNKLLRLFERTNNGRVEFGVIEEITNARGRTNRFPPAHGAPEAFVFRNNLTGLGEFEETCRTLHTDAGTFLVCRTIRPDQGFHYQTFVREAPTPS